MKYIGNILKRRVRRLDKKTGFTLHVRRNTHVLKVLFEKETAEFINSRRMLLFVVLTALITISGFYAALSGLTEALSSGNASADFLFLKLFTVSANSIPSYNSLMALMAPFIGIFMGFDAINSERSEGTLNRLVSQPLYRDNIIIVSGRPFYQRCHGILLGTADRFCGTDCHRADSHRGRSGQTVYLSMLLRDIHRLLAGHGNPVLHGLPSRGHLGSGLHCGMAVLRYFYQPAGRNYGGCAVSCKWE